MNVDYGAIGQRIKQVRRSRDMTQERLAEALSVSVGYISQIERGVTKINLDTLAAVAAHLNCELSELVTGVSVLQGRYLEGELAQLVDQMDGRQRKMLSGSGQADLGRVRKQTKYRAARRAARYLLFCSGQTGQPFCSRRDCLMSQSF
ncbi:helix-turn-helix transcriptional regulator [Flavonifractor plautii]|nr:helix-turn-helix transcriptional regulator [Flavonifractor plautii]